MKNTLTIRYKCIHRIVNDLYISLGFNSYPIDINILLNSFKNIVVIPYSTLKKDFNLTNEELFSNFSSSDGCCHYQKKSDKYIINYNDITINNSKRIYWTIIHELGHIFCNHYSLKENLFSNYTDDEIYDFKEREANYFVSIFLAHPAILNELNIKSSYEIEVFCNLSSQAAKYRFDSYNRFINHKFFTSSDRYIIRNFKEYINSKTSDFKEHLAFLQAFQ